MRALEDKYVDCIKIPDIENGITKKNVEMFDFPGSQYQMIGKKAMILLCAQVALFIAWVKINQMQNEPLLIALSIVLILVALWYQYEVRFMRYYKKARKGAQSLAADYTLKFINKIVASKNIYYNGMPIVYTLLKAKALLKSNDIIAAEVITENLLKEHTKCFEAWYVKGLCAYAYEEDQTAYERLLQVSQQRNIEEKMKKRAKELTEQIKASGSKIDVNAVSSADIARQK